MTVKSNSLTGSKLVRTEAQNGFDDAYAKELLASGMVDYIEPNYIVSIDRTPNDSGFSQLWGMHNTGQDGGTADVDIDGPAAWDLSTGSSSVVVGVVDTGVNFNHGDLAANMWVNTGEIADNGVDDDGNGVIDDIYGYNAVSNNGNPLDDNGHGTHCAGTIGGVGNNGTGVAGINWRVKIMALKFLSSSGSGTTQGAVDAITYAVHMKQRGVNLRVLSNSWGGGGYSQALADAIAAANSAGILFVAAAGNEANDNDVSPNYPSNYDSANVVAVAAVDHNGNLASFSNYGATTVDVAAPGVNIYSTYGSDYRTLSGTSMATPHVAGAAALLAAYDGSLTAAQLKSRLLTTIKPLATLNGAMVAPGIVSAYRAMVNRLAPTPPPPPAQQYSKAGIAVNFDTNFGSRILNQDDGYVVKNLGFAFPYFDTMFSNIVISANGRVIPITSNGSAPETPDYSNNLNLGICPYADDLYPSPLSPSVQGVWFKSEHNVATITWVVVPYSYRNSAVTDRELRIQLKIKQSGVIEFHYGDARVGDASYDYGASASIGLAPPTGVSGQKLTVTHNQADSSEVNTGKALRFTDFSSGSQGNAPKDYDSDGVSDIIVFRPPTGMWYILTSSSGFSFAQHKEYQLGLWGDLPQTGDFDGDKKVDFAVWRPATGTWFFRLSSTNYADISGIQWGLPGDTPLTADYDGDGKSDLAVYRQSTGGFYVLTSSSGFNRDGAFAASNNSMIAVSLGGPANDPVVGDFTGDGKADFGVVWQLVRFWSIKDNSNQLVSSTPWGLPGDTPIVCDWDHDGVDDRGVTRINEKGFMDWWVVAATGLGYTDSFGLYGDIPSCSHDFDGDGRADISVFRPSLGMWFYKESSTHAVKTFQFGLPGDVPM